MLGTHVIKSWSTNQAVIALSSGEAEYYGMVKGASQSLGLRGLADDLGVTYKGPIQINTDASAAVGIGSRLGTGKVRHIEVNQLWLQDKVCVKEIKLNKVGTNDNIADAITKAVNAETLRYHVENSSAECRRDQHHIAPMITEDHTDEGEDHEEVVSEQERCLESGVAEERTFE